MTEATDQYRYRARVRLLNTAFAIGMAVFWFVNPTWRIELAGETFYSRHSLWSPPRFVDGASVCWLEASGISALFLLIASYTWWGGRLVGWRRAVRAACQVHDAGDDASRRS